MIWLILFGVLIFLIWYSCIKPMSYWKNLGVSQTKPWPLFGDAWVAIFKKFGSAEFVEWLYFMHPNSRYMGYYQFTAPLLLLRDPELIKQITVKDFDHFTDHRPFVGADTDQLWRENLFALRGQKWREMRATLSGSFTSSKMKIIFNLMEEAAEGFTQFFLNKNEDIVEAEFKETYTRYTNDVIATAAFGIKCDSLTEPKNVFYLMGKKITDVGGIKTVMKIFAFLLFPKIIKLFKVSFLNQESTGFFKSIIKETIKTREERGIVRKDMINLLLEARKGIKHEEKEAIETGFATVKESTHIGHFKQIKSLTNDDIASQALIFFFAGFDTISTGLCFGSYELAINKDIQDKLRDEIKETHKKINGKITYDILLNMKYMDMVVSEILRKWSPVPSIDRICTKPYVIEPVNSDEKPVPIKVGDLLTLPIHGIHRDPVYYPNPDKFDPERFSDENKGSIQPYTYIPFGAGPRNCIGSRFALLEIKALLFNLLLHFEVVPTKKTSIPLKLDKQFIQNTAEGGFWLGLKRIKN